ncbi:hypothetical protein FIBSPDRAFT_748690 [Athelia psychrophila]|uniref:T6SS Phospholipase effector Tle1-like catalytic domain-containing protein n=1 Tax=Athelia psychrophila TaxID=1759441 RepID=A0A166F941_9AGAM|nr:hypothetical protein FIBSPDRAFT_748690 [Fibularhizoctonia sp. CBS 109695]
MKDPCQCSAASAGREGRNLVICIDGTSNELGITNTNVIELYSQILKDKHGEQLTYYDSGIGTYATPTGMSWSHLMLVMENKVDLVTAWNLEKVIVGAYQWLSNQYRQGDKIFLFGFSRGAYQVRALAGMIETVGLLLPGNQSQIPLYAGKDKAGKDKALAPMFKKMLSRTDVRVHFVGVWDTVSSVGLMRPKKMLPRIAECFNHVCYFRHALALDERRVKFLPEYVHEGRSHTPHEPSFLGQKKCTADIKEVWFAGTHSDVYQLGDRPLLWMRNEAIMAGLHLKTVDINLIKWKLIELECEVKPSLSGIWKFLEYFPVRRLSYKGHHITTRRFHRGKSRKIVEGQKIHASVMFRPGYKPSPAFPQNIGTWPVSLRWDDPHREERLAELDDIWEKDLFDHIAAKDIFTRLENDKLDSTRILELIAFMTSSGQPRFTSLNDPHSHRVFWSSGRQKSNIEGSARSSGYFGAFPSR